MAELEPNCKNAELESEPEKKTKSETKIRHLVISGGGEIGVSFVAVLEASNQAGFWKIEDIETIYGTSAGALFGTLIAFKKFFTWDIICTFLLKRPWNEVFVVNADNILSSFANGGIMNKKTTVDFFRPILNAIDLNVNITMQELYEVTGIEMHYMTTNIDDFKLVDISYKTHPQWKMVEAVYASCALPGMFQPVIIDGRLYADGAILCNFPLTQCLKIAEHPDEVFALEKICEETNTDLEPTEPTHIPNLLTYLSGILLKLLNKAAKPDIYEVSTRNIIQFSSRATNGFDIHQAAISQEKRAELYEIGLKKWEDFFANLQNSPLF
jgi:NTE family protein